MHFIDDSKDEFLLFRIRFDLDGVCADYNSYLELEDFFSQLDAHTKEDLNSWVVGIDLNLGIISGIEAIRSIRQNRDYDNLIVGICMGSDDPKDRSDALEAGAIFFMTKPMSGSVLDDICEEVPDLSMEKCSEPGVTIMRNFSAQEIAAQVAA